MTNPQIILDEPGNPACAVFPWQEFNQLAESYSEIKMNDKDLQDQAGVENEESFPIEVLDRLLAAENTIRVYRNHHNMTQKQLARIAGINTDYLSQIERGQCTNSAETLQAITRALNIEFDALIGGIFSQLSWI